MKIKLPSVPLPEKAEDLYSMLHDYFSGKQVTINPGSNIIDINWPMSPEHYIDQNLKTGLEWWGTGTQVSTIPFEVKNCAGYQLSLNDNWTLYAWSKWLAGRFLRKDLPKKIVILHVDDHRDCMSPMLFIQPGSSYLDPLTNNPISLLSPESVRSAIESGTIAVGSFMPLFFHENINIEFRHLLPSHRMPMSLDPGLIERTFESDKLLSVGAKRPALAFESKTVNTGLSYFPTDNLDLFLNDIPKTIPILFHVDMDYFNNRFDGDSDWIPGSTHDPAEVMVMSGIQSVFSKVLTAIPQNQIEDITIALSPGFFPSEYWQQSIEIIDDLMYK